MIKVKLLDLWNSFNNGAIAALSTNKELYGEQSLILRELKRSITPHIDDFSSVFNEKLEKYGKKNENGSFNFEGDSKESFEKEMQEIAEKEVELSIDKLPKEFVFRAKISDDQISLLEKWLLLE